MALLQCLLLKPSGRKLSDLGRAQKAKGVVTALYSVLPEVLSMVSVGPQIPYLTLESFWSTLPYPYRNFM